MGGRAFFRWCLSLKFRHIDGASQPVHILRMPKRSSKGRKDLNQLAASIIERATGEASRGNELKKNPAAVAFGHLGGSKGGVARAKKLTAEERSRIAKKAARKRWDDPAS